MAWGAAGLSMLACAVTIRAVQPRVSEKFAALRHESDSYALPAPEQVVVASLGYRSALADYLFAWTRVSYGLHFEEKRRFDRVGDYLETIVALDPEFRTPLRFADTMLIFQPKLVPPENYRFARDFLERGLARHPDDADLWLQSGQFTAYLAPPHLPQKESKDEWRYAGARMLARACDLMGGNKNLPYHCMTAASLFSGAGQREATIQSLERILAVSDDEEVRRRAMGFLREQVDQQAAERIQARGAKVRAIWGRQLPMMSRNIIQMMGPQFDEALCSGRRALEEAPECATSWRDWTAERF